MSYQGDPVTQRVKEILQLPDIRGWSVVDQCDNLVLVHYNEDADMTVYGHLRGILIDVETGDIVANSFGYTPTAVCDKFIEDDGKINIKDQDGINHSFSVKDSVIKRVFEGVVIRDIWHKSKRYRITHRKIQPLRSRWGSSASFISMYEEAGQPTDDELFDTSKPFSSSCYVFLVSHPSLFVGTRQSVERPYIVYLAHYEMKLSRPAADVAPGLIGFKRDNKIEGVVERSFIHDPLPLTIDEANRHLRVGYYNEFEAGDARQTTGESVIIYRMDNNNVIDVVKVHSKAYDWRLSMRGNNPNIEHQFYMLLNKTYSDLSDENSWRFFSESFITFPLYDKENLESIYAHRNFKILSLPLGATSRFNYSTRDERIHLLWINYVLSLPPTCQGTALNLLDKFMNDRNNLIVYIQRIEAGMPDIEQFHHDVQLVNKSEIQARDRIKKVITS